MLAARAMGVPYRLGRLALARHGDTVAHTGVRWGGGPRYRLVVRPGEPVRPSRLDVWLTSRWRAFTLRWGVPGRPPSSTRPGRCARDAPGGDGGDPHPGGGTAPPVARPIVHFGRGAERCGWACRVPCGAATGPPRADERARARPRPAALRRLDRRYRDGVRDPRGARALALLALRPVQRRDARTGGRSPPRWPRPGARRNHRRHLRLRRGADRAGTGPRHRGPVDRHRRFAARPAPDRRPPESAGAGAAGRPRRAGRASRLDEGDRPAGPCAARGTDPGQRRRRAARVVRRARSAPGSPRRAPSTKGGTSARSPRSSPPSAFGFGSAPRTPSLVRVTTTVGALRSAGRRGRPVARHGSQEGGLS